MTRIIGANPYEPLGARSLVDDNGNVIVSGETDGDITGDALTEFILYRVWNGSFSIGPPDPSQPISAANALPYFTGPVDVSGGSMTAVITADTTYPRQQGLDIIVAPGAANDEVYFEQITPFGGSRKHWTGNLVRCGLQQIIATATFRAVLAIQYLTLSGATTGASIEQTVDCDDGDSALQVIKIMRSSSPPTDATFIRIRFGIRRAGGAAATDTGTFRFFEVRQDIGQAAVVLADGGSYAPGVLYQYDGQITLGPNNGSSAVAPDFPYLELDASAGGFPAQARLFLSAGGALQLNNGHLQVEEAAAPSTPGSGYGAIYQDTSGLLHALNDGGLDVPLAGHVGWLPFAYPWGISSVSVSTSNNNLIAVAAGLGGAVVTPIILAAPMNIQSVTVWQGATANARAAEFRIFRDNGDSTIDYITGTSGTFSFTPAAADERTANVGTPGTYLPPGVYFFALRNTSAAQTFVVRAVAGGAQLTGNNRYLWNTGGLAALGTTLDITSSESQTDGVMMVRLNGRIAGQSTAY